MVHIYLCTRLPALTPAVSTWSLLTSCLVVGMWPISGFNGHILLPWHHRSCVVNFLSGDFKKKAGDIKYCDIIKCDITIVTSSIVTSTIVTSSNVTSSIVISYIVMLSIVILWKMRQHLQGNNTLKCIGFEIRDQLNFRGKKLHQIRIQVKHNPVINTLGHWCTWGGHIENI